MNTPRWSRPLGRVGPLMWCAAVVSCAQLAPMPVGRYEFQALAAGREIVVFGGMDSGSELVKEVDAYDVRRNRWSRRSSLPTPRYFLCGATLEGRLYAIGGEDDNRETPPRAVVERYDPATDRWERVADLPQPRTHAVAVACDRKLYVIGGYRRGHGNLSDVDVYDPASNAWTPGPPLPLATHGIAAAAIGGAIHVAGGDADPRLHLVLEEGRWRNRAPLPAGRLFAEAEEAGGRLYLVGGGSNDEEDAFRSVLEYDPGTDRWTRKSGAATPRYHFETAAIEGRIFAMGGMGIREGDPRALGSVGRYDPIADRWSE